MESLGLSYFRIKQVQDWEKNIVTTISIGWLLITIYHSFFGIPDFYTNYVLIGWFITIILCTLGESRIKAVGLLNKILALLVITSVTFYGSAYAIGFLSELTPKIDNTYMIVASLTINSSLASIFVALLISIPIVVIYRENYLVPILLAVSPVTIIRCKELISLQALLGQMLIGFEIVFLFVVIWFCCYLINKILIKTPSGVFDKKHTSD